LTAIQHDSVLASNSNNPFPGSSHSRLLGVLDRRWWRRLEALQQEGCVDHKGHRQGDQGVHKDVQLGLAEAVLA